MRPIVMRYIDTGIPAIMVGKILWAVEAAPADPLPFLVSDVNRAQPFLVSDIFPPTSRPTTPDEASFDLPPRGERRLVVRSRGSFLDDALGAVWPFAASATCHTCERTMLGALADQQRLKRSERDLVIVERGHVSLIAVCDECLMPLGYQVASDTTDPAAPTEAQRGPARRPTYRGGWRL